MSRDGSEPNFPIYIVSKGRWKSRLTVKALENMGVPYRIVVEQSEFDNYAEFIDKSNILVLPKKFQERYDTFDNLGMSRSVGPGAARNFCWEHSIKLKHKWHWVMDDNLDAFHRLNRNCKSESDTGVIFRIMEDFVLRYKNIGIAGPNYYSFVKTADKVPPFITNTRIYSCLLINNDLDIRWRGRYNEDTDLSLRVLKSGLATVQFNAFLCGKVTTQRMAGGNTKEFYKAEGTLNKSKMLAEMHPDVAKVVWRFNRWHHHVDYRPFKHIQLQFRDDYIQKMGINNYGMELKEFKRR